MTAVGDIVVCHALDWRPHLLVISTDGDSVRTVLLADLARASIQRLRHGATAPVVTAVRRADELPTYRLPQSDIAPSPVMAATQ